jgi:hypothetical protein
VCEQWEASFENFLADMGERPDGCTLDRINADGDYEPSNCRWASQREQQNNRSNNRVIELGDKRLTLAQWGRDTGLGPGCIERRLAMGWDVARALTQPKRTCRTRRKKAS